VDPAESSHLFVWGRRVGLPHVLQRTSQPPLKYHLGTLEVPTHVAAVQQRPQHDDRRPHIASEDPLSLDTASTLSHTARPRLTNEGSTVTAQPDSNANRSRHPRRHESQRRVAGHGRCRTIKDRLGVKGSQVREDGMASIAPAPIPPSSGAGVGQHVAAGRTYASAAGLVL
jgi:hypothetical protein